MRMLRELWSEGMPKNMEEETEGKEECWMDGKRQGKTVKRRRGTKRRRRGRDASTMLLNY